MRKISKTLALMSLLAPLGANALGIGDIRLHSALNQSLDAEIPLVTSGDDDISEIRVALASQEAFAKADIERHYLLSKLRFKPQQREDGSYVIKVSSQEAIHEPFLDFMIEVYWPQGRLQREFTVLLDPPASFQEPADGYEAELAETEPYQHTYEAPPRRSTSTEPAPAKPRRPAIKEARASEAPPTPQEEVPVNGTQYGPISKNETLWSIAQRHSQDAGVSPEKMLRALYRANPHAFYKHNINALKAGETITIPDRETVARLTGSTAASPSLRTGRPAGKPQKSTEEIAGQGEQGQLKLVAPTSGKSKDEAASSGGRGKSGGTKEAALAEANETFKQENEEMRKRLADIEQQLAGMQRLLSLKNEEIAALQAQKQGAKPAPEPAPTPSAEQPATGAESSKKTPPVAPEPSKEAARPAPAQPAQQQATPTPPETTQAPPAPQPAPTIPPRPAPAKRPQTAAPSPTKESKEQGVVANLLDHPVYLVGGIAGLFAVALWLVKRRRAAMIDDTESILTLSDREKAVQLKRAPVQQHEQPSSGISEQSTTMARSSFLSEFTPSDFDALGGEMEEVDPISEADVYLAYGRYKQAEELIRSAIAQNPERDECKLKLLEIHYATENAEAFESFAEELVPTHKDTKPDFWEKVAEMGQELCPDSPLFDIQQGGARRSGTAEAKGMDADAEGGYFFQREETESYGYPISPVAAERQQRHDANEEVGSPEATIAYDFFSGETALESGKREEEEGKFGSPHGDNVIAFEPSRPTAPAATDGAMDVQDKTLDDILAELGVLSESSATASKKSGEDDENRDRGMPFDLGEAADEAEEAPQYEESPDYMALTEMDEHETKLDLAKAYFDMGDEDSARTILENVAQQGNDAQKREAHSLLNKIGRKEEANRR